jgi:phosphatidylglycerophosphate synthase
MGYPGKDEIRLLALNLPLVSTRKKLQQGIYKVINPFVRLLIRMGLTPNMVTTIGLILNIGVAIIFICGAEEGRRGDLRYLGWAGGLILFAGLFDMLDGQVARLGNMSSPFGALYDSVLDRYSELILFLGICWYLVAHHYFISSLFAFIGLIGSMMVSYTRARAEGLGIECKDGLMQRPERVILIGVSALACGIASRWMGGNYKIPWPNSNFPLFETISIFTIPLTIMAILANFTAIGRLRDAKRALEARAAAASKPNSTNQPANEANQPANGVTTTISSKKSSLPGTTVIIILAISLMMGLPTGAQTASASSGSGSPNSAGILHPRPPVINDPVDTFPVPPTNANSLFYLQRTPNPNTIICELNWQKDGSLDKDEPVKVLWIRYTEQRQRAELSWIQRHFAYGLKEKDLGNGVYELRFVSWKKTPMYLQKTSDNRYRVYVNIDGRQAVLTRVYIRIDPGGTFWSPNVKYLELKGMDAQTGRELTTRLKV